MKANLLKSCLLGAATLPTLSSPPAFSDELLISAAISMKDVLQQMAVEFERQHPGLKIIINAASSGALEKQIEAGAPVDLFVSAGKVEVDELNKHQLLAAPPQAFAYNRLVCIRYAAPQKIATLADLVKLDAIAIGNPRTVPAGRYAVEALKKAQVYDTLERTHKLVYAENVRAVLSYVEQNNVDAGIVYESDAAQSRIATIACRVPKDASEPIAYFVAPIKHSKNPNLAREFVQYFSSEKAHDALIEHHFETKWK